VISDYDFKMVTIYVVIVRI